MSSSDLKRVYGYFRCTECGKTWESSHVYCKKGTAEYGQECKGCRVMCKPYRVERLKCSVCGQQQCICAKRHTNPNKAHRRDLCGKCRAGLPCMDS